MEYSITLLSRNPKALVEFWIKALGLHLKNESITDTGEYDYADLYYRNHKIMTVSKSTIDTSGLEISIMVVSLKKEFAKLSNRGLDCERISQSDSFFSINDPQGNWLCVRQNTNFKNNESEL